MRMREISPCPQPRCREHGVQGCITWPRVVQLTRDESGLEVLNALVRSTTTAIKTAALIAVMYPDDTTKPERRILFWDDPLLQITSCAFGEQIKHQLIRAISRKQPLLVSDCIDQPRGRWNERGAGLADVAFADPSRLTNGLCRHLSVW
jgi:hypothetical protein